MICHVFEVTHDDITGHEKVKCTKKCVRKKPCGHPCPYKCFECKEKEMPCLTEVEKTFDCGHDISYLCKDKDKKESNECNKPCERKLKCGHPCLRVCKISCMGLYQREIDRGYTSPCKEVVEKTL